MNLQQISDRLEIQDLLVEYCHAIDRHEWDALDEVFTSDAIIDYTEMVPFKGSVAETKAFLSESLKGLQATQHIVSTSKITIDGDRAHGRTVCTNPMVLPGGHVMIVGLWYKDEFVRTDKGWRISARYEENCWRFNVPAGLLAEG
ncbi:MAG: nuclear transport factor 2 family protein [Janthinobacterium lividum]